MTGFTAPQFVFATTDELQHHVADAFTDLVTDVCSSKDRFNVSLSGGSTPKRLYELLADRELPWDRIHWFWGDERNVPPDHQDSNFRMVRQALLDHIDAPEKNIHPVPVDVDDPDKAALDYEGELWNHFAGLPPRWDLVLLGMGDDAHTASLFPETKAIDQNDRTFVANWVPKFDGYRYTLTQYAINSGAEIWFLIAGANKRTALNQVMGHDRNRSLYPAQLIHPTRWFLTRDATS